MRNFTAPLPTSISETVDTFADDINKIVNALTEIRNSVPSSSEDIGAVSVSDYNALINRLNSIESSISKLETPASTVTAPGAPTITGITATDATVSVSFTPPANNGGAAITKYVATTSTGRVVEGTFSPIIITGLTNGTAITVTLKAVNSAGTSTASAPSAPVTPVALAKPSVPVNVTGGVIGNSATINWNVPTSDGGSAITGYRVARDGVDGNGYGVYTTDLSSTTRTFTFANLVPGSRYNLTIGAINANGVGTLATYVANIPSGSTTTPDPVTNPGTNPLGLKALTAGASVTGAANGDFNRFAGSRVNGLYCNWGQDGYWKTVTNAGKNWGVLGTASTVEYAAHRLPVLGRFDIDLAPQFGVQTTDGNHRVTAGGWASARNDASMRTWLVNLWTDLRANLWMDSSQKVYIRPYHEFNGNWYQHYEVVDSTQASYFVEHWRNVIYPAFQTVFGNDDRVLLEWCPNRDGSYGLDVRSMYPGAAYVDIHGVDYYDFAWKDSTNYTDAAWSSEINSTQAGGPRGIETHRQFALQQGKALIVPETGQQFRDNPWFVNKMFGYLKQHGYTGTGSPAGKVVSWAWHNLQGRSPDPNAGGDFFIQVNGGIYNGRPNASRAYQAILKAGGLRTV